MAISDSLRAGPTLALSPEHEMIRQTARDFARREIAPVAAHHDETGEFPRETVRKMGALGLMGIEIPEEYGGAGLDSLAYVLALEEICKVDAAHGTIMSVNNSLFCYAVYRFGTEEQKQRFLRPVASGAAIGAYSLTEPMSGSDAGTMRSRAQRQGDGYRINGRKSWVTSAPVADFIIVFSMTDPSQAQRGITAFLIDTAQPGFSVGKVEPKLGIRASATSEIVFEDYQCPQAQRLGAEGEGFKIAMAVLDAGRIGIAAQALGIAAAAYEASLAYAREREAFGQPIGQFQGIGFKLADMAVKVDAARLLIWRAGWMANANVPFTRGEGSMAKLYAGDIAVEVCIDALQVLGGYGYMREYPVEKWLRDSKIYQIWEGTAEIQRLVISRALGGRGF